MGIADTGSGGTAILSGLLILEGRGTGGGTVRIGILIVLNLNSFCPFLFPRFFSVDFAVKNNNASTSFIIEKSFQIPLL